MRSCYRLTLGLQMNLEAVFVLGISYKDIRLYITTSCKQERCDTAGLSLMAERALKGLTFARKS